MISKETNKKCPKQWRIPLADIFGTLYTTSLFSWKTCLCRWHSDIQVLHHCRIPPSTRCPCFSLQVWPRRREVERQALSDTDTSIIWSSSTDQWILMATARFVCYVVCLKRKACHSVEPYVASADYKNFIQSQLYLMMTSFSLESGSLTGINTNINLFAMGLPFFNITFFLF